ncbi:Zn(II)2Cys6 transcription factor [Aspergillus foveolatus]|uniref:Zn(II)2Cys6 transcription factor n=1 Tax=Aspergillus foveolatus TaxID=210207 RepID=UPI003CCE1D6D
MDPIGTFNPQKRPGDNPADQQRRKRARQSCETCKARKTKCVGLENGTCQYCTQLGLLCQVNLKARKRPFYRISEAAYESSIALLRLFVSEEELPELTVEGIQDVLSKLGDAANDKERIGANPYSLSHSRSPTDLSASSVAAIEEPPEGVGAEAEAEAEEGGGSLSQTSTQPCKKNEAAWCWIHSENTATSVQTLPSAETTRRVAQHATSNTDPKVIAPLKTGLLPPRMPVSLTGSARGAGAYLPPAAMAMRYAAFFFQESHCLYWFYSLEKFYGALEEAPEDHGAKASASWMCSLYLIFAIGSMAPDNQIARAGKDAEGDSVRQTTLPWPRVWSLKVSGCMQYAIAFGAYLHLGTAVRIGFSLGLHRNISPRKSSSVERERARRLWWTIYTLDHEMPSGLDIPAPLVMDFGPNMPLEYQALCVSLVRIRKKIGQSYFVVLAQAGGRLPIRQVFESLNALQTWSDEIPQYFSREASQPPQHRRAVSILHLRYWSSVIFVTRPFLLYTVSRSSVIKEPAKAQCYEEISRKCIEAAEQSVDIFKRMVKEQTLSSRILFDCHCIGEAMWILILAVQKLGHEKHRQLFRLCLETVRGMEQFGWCEKVAPELEARVHESGIMQPQSRGEMQYTQQSGHQSLDF